MPFLVRIVLLRVDLFGKITLSLLLKVVKLVFQNKSGCCHFNN